MSDRRTVQAFSFDLDRTLLDGSGLQGVIVRTCELLAESQPSLNSQALAEGNGRIWPGYWQDIEEKWTLGSLDGASVILEAWRRTLKACDWNDESTAQLAARIHSKLGREAYRLFDDVHEVVRDLKRVGIPLALIINGASDTQRDKLQVLGIEEWFDAIVISGELGTAKPDPMVFQLAAKGLRTAEANICHVGDELAADIGGARTAALTAVWLNRSRRSRKQSDPEPHLEIGSLAMLKGLVGA
jgi:putative hydrolase of the HAD superfamily